jgi:hypothetical protein
MDRITDETDWRAIYQRYVQLERIWHVDEASEPIARQFFRRIVHGHQSESAILREFRSFRLEPPPPDLLREAFYLQSMLYPSDCKRPGGRHPDDPFENVYAAALSMLPHGFWEESPELTQLYRGQRDVSWPTTPKLFRNEDVEGALKQLALTVPRVQACMPSLSVEQAVAVAQHYSEELGVATWLLDLTYDPRVALFFASDDGVKGKVGVVVCLVRKEWNELSAGGTNRLGAFRVIDVPGVLRIEHQRASFLDTSHPELFDQYVAHSVWFRQVDGLRFEDPDAAFPVTAERIYPKDDPLAAALLNTPPAVEGVLQIGPAGDAREALGSAAYLAIAQSWCRQAGVEIDAYHDVTLKAVCDVHARLQAQRDQFNLPDRSLARLQDAVSFVMDAQRKGTFITLREALRWSLSRLPPGTCKLLEDIIADCARAKLSVLTTPTHLRDSLLDLDNDIDGLPGRRVALLGFREPNAKRIADNLHTLCDTAGWVVVDVRDPQSCRVPLPLIQALEAPKLALILEVAVEIPANAAMLIRDLHDSRDLVHWADGTETRLPENRMLYVIAIGARSVEELPTLLQKIDFMTFLKPAT